MDDVPYVDPYSDVNPPSARHIVVAFCQGALHLNCTLAGLQRTIKFKQECVADCFDLDAMEPKKNTANDFSMLFEQAQRKSLIPLSDPAVARHVGEHDGGKSSLLEWGNHSIARVGISGPPPARVASVLARVPPRDGCGRCAGTVPCRARAPGTILARDR